MDVQIIASPYDSGHHAKRTGLGPQSLLDAGLALRLDKLGLKSELTTLASSQELLTENVTGFEVMRLASKAVSEATAAGRFPLLLAGNCNVSVGALAGLTQPGGPGAAPFPGVLWLDAHGDLNTPETTRSGFLDGMGLAMALGRCWQEMTRAIPGFIPIPDNRVAHLGLREPDPGDLAVLGDSRITTLMYSPAEAEVLEQAAPLLDDLRERTERVFIHLDLDVLGLDGADANRFNGSKGWSVDCVEELVRKAKERFTIAGAAVSSFEPDYDAGGRVVEAGLRLIEALFSD